MPSPDARYYRSDLARVHHEGFGHHADACAPGILQLLEPIRDRRGVVLELGCGSGILTRHLIDAGHHVIATDASPAMLELARRHAPEAELRVLALPDDPLPEADAVVSVGHVLSYLDDEAAVERALASLARALRANGLFAIDLCDLEWGVARRAAPPFVRVEDDWTIVTRFSMPSPSQFVRDITVFVRNDEGTWRRDDERYENVLVDMARLPALLASLGVEATITKSFGAEELPRGLRVVIGRREATI